MSFTSALRSVNTFLGTASSRLETTEPPSDLAAWQTFCAATEPPAEEPFVELYRSQLLELNAIVRASGELLEGNLFYHHRVAEISDRPDPTRRHKRMLLAAFAMGGDHLLEIGFNAGHSALLALTANPGLAYRGVDIGLHRYTRPCFDYLKQVFGGRIDLRVGSSAELLPRFAAERPRRWRRLHVDGGHKIETAYHDLALACTVAGQGGLILVDDINVASVRAAANMLVMQGRCSVRRLLPGFSEAEQAVLSVG